MDKHFQSEITKWTIHNCTGDAYEVVAVLEVDTFDEPNAIDNTHRHHPYKKSNTLHNWTQGLKEIGLVAILSCIADQ